MSNNKITSSVPQQRYCLHGWESHQLNTGKLFTSRPVSIVTFWDQINCTSIASIVIRVILGVAVLAGGCFICRGWNRKEYRPLSMHE